ncbi:prolyl-tRNA synthetase associated domain-containing protein [Hyphobacterium sp.]|uniref:prolyl-tRNA synthetase associated domain-containing protein n=1 Tax=Hyphobacterium sp. TaxID=2004662 RepID=UPI003B51A9A7
MPATREDLFRYLDELGIAHSTLDHEPVFTVAEGEAIKAGLPGGHTKNLFLKDKKGRLVLVSALGDSAVPVNRLHRLAGCQRLSFAKEEDLWSALGVRPGSVTAFALMNDRSGSVCFVIEKALLDHDPVNFHPLRNDATTAISPDDLLAFARATGHEPLIADFAALAAAG